MSDLRKVKTKGEGVMRKLTLAGALAAADHAGGTSNGDELGPGTGDWKPFEGRVQTMGKTHQYDLPPAKGRGEREGGGGRGRQKILAGKIQERYGVTKEEADNQVNPGSTHIRAARAHPAALAL